MTDSPPNEPLIWPAGAPSPPTVRVIEILERLASAPERAFGASELARLLDLNKSTCLSILSTLTDAGYLIQHPRRKDYRLGPALITLSRSARAVLPDLSRVRPILRDVAEHLGVIVNVTGILEGQIVILEVAGSADAFGGVLRLGVRVPLMPPYGAVHVAFLPTVDRDEWLLDAPGPCTPDQLAGLEQVIELARMRGFLVTLDLPADDELAPIQNQMRGLARRLDSDDFRALARHRLTPESYLLGEIDPTRRYSVGQIQAPIRGEPGGMPLALAANFSGEQLSGSQIGESAARLIEAAGAVALSRRAGASTAR